MEDGGHAVEIEYILVAFAVLDLLFGLNPFGIDLGEFIGRFLGVGITNLNFIGQLLGELNDKKPFAEVARNAKNKARDEMDNIAKHLGGDLVILGGLVGGFKEGVGEGVDWISYNLHIDPSVFRFLSSPLGSGPAPIPPRSQLGVNAQIVLDGFFTESVGDAEVPLVYKVQIQNTGPSTDTFRITLPPAPPGYTLQSSVPEITVPPGQTAEVGICLRPINGIGTPGTSVPFDVTVTSKTNSAVTATDTETLVTPDVHGVTLTPDPAFTSASPGSSVFVELAVTAAGNVAENVTLSADLPNGVTLNGLPSNVSLAQGETKTFPLTLTVSNSAALNSTLTPTITVNVAGLSGDSKPSTTIQLNIRSAAVVSVEQAATKAANANHTQLAGVLSQLSDLLGQWEANPSDARLCKRAQLQLDNVKAMLAATPSLAQFASRVDALRTEAANCNVAGIIPLLEPLFTDISNVFQFTQSLTLSLDPANVTLEPGQGRSLNVRLENQGNRTLDVSLALGSLPSGVTAALDDTQASLAPNAVRTIPLTLSQTLTSTTVFALEVTATSESVSQSAFAYVAVRPALADVLGVVVDPVAVDAGKPIAVRAQVLNSANAARAVLAHVAVLDAAGAVVATPPDIPVNLVPGTGALDVDLGVVNTMGLANGLYSLPVSLRAVDNAPLPGRLAQTPFFVGVPVTATVKAEPSLVPPGSPTVTTTIQVTNQTAIGQPTPGSKACTDDPTYPLGKWNANCVINQDQCADSFLFTSATGGTWLSSFGPGTFTTSGPLLAGSNVTITFTGPQGYSSTNVGVVSTDGCSITGSFSDNAGHFGTFRHDWAEQGKLHAQLKWSWTSSQVLPDHLNVMMTPAVIDLNGDGIPDVVFGATSSRGGGLVEVGVLRALNGDDGSELFTVTDPTLSINTVASIAVGDIDGDGKPDIIAVDTTGARLIAFEHDGIFKWRSPFLEGIYWGAPALADLDGDGIPEIIVGRQVLNNDGSIRWTGTGGSGNQGVGPLSLVADINLDGSPDVVAGNTVYTASGQILCQAPVPDGFNAVANFDDDPFPEIVLVSGGWIWLLDHDCKIKWGPVPIPGGGRGGPPTIADYDGDGKPEIGIAGATRYAVFEADGSLKWAAVTQDASSNVTGSSVFDFEGDGSAEVVYRDELNLRVFRGTDGAVLFETPMSSCTWHEYVLVADVDNDGHAEIVAVANDNCGYGPQRGVFVFGDVANRWVPTRKIWNQHTYHITNVNEDGTIPRVEQNNWQVLGLNNYRLNTFSPGDRGTVEATIAVHHRLPATGYAVDPASVSPQADTISTSEVLWTGRIPFNDPTPRQFQLTGQVPNMAPGETRQISLGSEVDAIVTAADGTQIPITIPLPPLVVAAAHILDLDPPSQTAQAGAEATYTVLVKNPLTTDETFTLSTVGLDGFTVGLATSLTVGAGQTVSTPLHVDVPGGVAEGARVFSVFAQTAEGALDSVDGELTVSGGSSGGGPPPHVELDTLAVDVALSPSQATAGQGTAATYFVRVTNVGDEQDTYTLSGSFPAGFKAEFADQTVTVLPGLGNYRDVELQVTPPPGTALGNHAFTVTARSNEDAGINDQTNGTVNVVGQGVDVDITPSSGGPTTTFQLTVRNTGNSQDTFDLQLGGPAGLGATLGASSVTLGPGASQTVPVTLGTLDFSLTGSLALVGVATSHANETVKDQASAQVSIGTSKGLTVAFNPTLVELPTPGPAAFLLLVNNIGNGEDSYTAEIMSTTGPVTAALNGLTRQATQKIDLFRLPGLSTGGILLNSELTTPGEGKVTVKVTSLENPTLTAQATATVHTPGGSSNHTPEVEAGSNQNAKTGETISLAPATFTDVDTSDTHTATVNWGDGVQTGATVSESNGAGSVVASHSYSQAQSYTVKVCVADNHEGQGCDTFTVTVSAQSTCPVCTGPEVVVDGVIALDAAQLAATAGVLAPFATFDGQTITIDLGSQPLHVTSKGRISVLAGGKLHGAAFHKAGNHGTPNVVLRSTCTLQIDEAKRGVVGTLLRNVSGVIETTATGLRAGDITLAFAGGMVINGGVQSIQERVPENPVALSGAITLQSSCGDIETGPTSWVFSWGDLGSGAITLQQTGTGNIALQGLVFNRTNQARGQNAVPTINVHAAHGGVTVDGGHLVVDEFNTGGTRYDLTSGLLTFSREPSAVGQINIQAQGDIAITRDVRAVKLNRASFAAVSTVVDSSTPQGGDIRVRSLGGTIVVRDQALQAAGKRDNGAALIEVIADKNLIVASPSALDGQHVPTLSTAASPVNNVGKGGLNVLQACDGNVRVEAGAQVVATGKSTPGRNEVTADNGTVTILGKVDPSPVAGAGCENPAPIW